MTLIIRGKDLWDKFEKEARKKFKKDDSYMLVAIDIGHVNDNEPVNSAWCKLKNSNGQFVSGYVDLK